jgi:hypothetical protein
MVGLLRLDLVGLLWDRIWWDCFGTGFGGTASGQDLVGLLWESTLLDCSREEFAGTAKKIFYKWIRRDFFGKG